VRVFPVALFSGVACFRSDLVVRGDLEWFESNVFSGIWFVSGG
jgi:hypothetical protein